ncbi:MAG TPA: hypothetical protein VIN07_04300 [Flavipsychrobacter sp.]
MRKAILLPALAAAIISMSSCERNFTCLCVYPDSNIGTTKTNIKAARKSDADVHCSSLNKAAQKNGGACALD